MLEQEKRDYPVYRAEGENNEARLVENARLAVYMTSDRRDEDNDGLCVYLKKTYRAIGEARSIKEGDVVLLGDEKARVISITGDGIELILHLESVRVIDTGALYFRGEDDV